MTAWNSRSRDSLVQVKLKVGSKVVMFNIGDNWWNSDWTSEVNMEATNDNSDIFQKIWLANGKDQKTN